MKTEHIIYGVLVILVVLVALFVDLHVRLEREFSLLDHRVKRLDERMRRFHREDFKEMEEVQLGLDDAIKNGALSRRTHWGNKTQKHAFSTFNYE